MRSGSAGGARYAAGRWLGRLSLGALALVSACTAAHAPAGQHAARSAAATPGPAVGARSPSAGGTPAGPPAPAVAPRWKLTWDDEFSGPAGLSRWVFVTDGLGGWLHQLQWYDSSNASVSHGDLVITASRDGGVHQCWYGPCKYRSVRMDTLGTFAQAYGRFEARIKFPPGQGLWPAFWLEGTDIGTAHWPAAGEIDVVEPRSQYPSIVQGWAHAPAPLHALNRTLQLPAPLSSGFHTYGVDWTPRKITWWADGRVYGTLKYYPHWPFDHPFFMILDLAVGGGYSGQPNAQTPFPAHMLVDWVRVYRHV